MADTDTADAAAAGAPEPVAEQKKEQKAPPRDDSLWQSVVILGWAAPSHPPPLTPRTVPG